MDGTTPDHILSSLTTIGFLNPTVMIHTAVCPALLHTIISFDWVNSFHGLGIFPWSVVWFLLPYGDGPPAGELSAQQKHLHWRPLHIWESTSWSKRLGVRCPNGHEDPKSRARMENWQRKGCSDYGPAGLPLGRELYPFRRGMADLFYSGANQATQ